MLKKLRTLLGRVIRDIGRKIEGDSGLEAAFAQLLMLARRVREQQQQRRPVRHPRQGVAGQSL
jgi:IS5 family transposase